MIGPEFFREGDEAEAELRDEIELLRREISDLNAGWQRTYDHDCNRMKSEIERLRGLLRDLLPEIDFADGELDPADDIVVLRLRERVREILGE